MPRVHYGKKARKDHGTEIKKDVPALAPQFSFESNVHDLGSGYTYRYLFCGEMLSTCSPLLDDCGDDYEVTELLKKKLVVQKGTQCDTEMCSVYFSFKTKAATESFLKRFNALLQKRHDRVQNDH